MSQACSDNNGRVSPTYPASQTGITALALFPSPIAITSTPDAGKCKEQIQFLATGGEPPYKFTNAKSAGTIPSQASIDSSGLYRADVAEGPFTDVVLVIDSIGARATSNVTITCGAAVP